MPQPELSSSMVQNRTCPLPHAPGPGFYDRWSRRDLSYRLYAIFPIQSLPESREFYAGRVSESAP
jgi:hypothetical protein